MNIFEGVAINATHFIWPLVFLGITMFFTGFLYSRLFKWLPKEWYDIFLGPVVLLLGGLIWFYPMHMGFYDFFK
ncbi:hypothetical protein [Metabacillus fastidiosus]|uniref:hypothetical protein n=1 Tax=Metabacillus fastidiosus TaxID=1458 RepID=UPI003D296E81